MPSVFSSYSRPPLNVTVSPMLWIMGSKSHFKVTELFYRQRVNILCQ